jgi:hypothetical protein
MNPTKQKIKEHLSTLPAEFSALKVSGLEYLKYCSSIELDGALQIAHRPWIAPLNYAIHIFPPAPKSWLKKFAGRKIPHHYQQFLLSTNGLFAFDLCLYGLPPSLQKSPALVDRSRLQCLDLTIANTDWAREFNVDPQLFLFGGSPHSDSENIGYFMQQNGKVRAIRKTGENLREWETFQNFLGAELHLARQKAEQQTDQSWWE